MDNATPPFVRNVAADWLSSYGINDDKIVRKKGEVAICAGTLMGCFNPPSYRPLFLRREAKHPTSDLSAR